MTNTVNMFQVFNSLDMRRDAAKRTIERFTPEQVQAASNEALIFNRCDKTSIKHLEDIARILTK